MKRIKPIKARADKLWSAIIRRNNNGMCEVCDQPATNPHHVIGRKTLNLRYEPKNGCLLCFFHHLGGQVSAHNDPIWFLGWFKHERPKDYEHLMKKRNQIEKINYEDIIKKLKLILE